MPSSSVFTSLITWTMGAAQPRCHFARNCTQRRLYGAHRVSCSRPAKVSGGQTCYDRTDKDYCCSPCGPRRHQPSLSNTGEKMTAWWCAGGLEDTATAFIFVHFNLYIPTCASRVIYWILCGTGDRSQVLQICDPSLANCRTVWRFSAPVPCR